MSDQNPDRYAHIFAGKTEAQLREIATPTDLSYHDAMAFRVARRQAIELAKEAANTGGPRLSAVPEPPPASVFATPPAPEDDNEDDPFAEAASPADEPCPEEELRDLECPLEKEDAAKKDAAAALLAKAKLDPIPLIIPMGRCEELLERQLASGAGLVEHLVQYIARFDSDVQACLQFADRICSVMKSSAGVAKAVGRLRGLGPEETRHRVFVEYAPQGGGVLRA